MPNINITRSVTNGQVFTQAQNETQLSSIETALNTTKLDSSNIQTGGIVLANLAANSVDSTKIAAGAVTTNAIAASAVTSAAIAANAVTTSAIATGAVVQAQLAARTTGTSVAAGGVAVSSSCGTFSTTNNSYTSVTNLSVTLTTTGRPVQVLLMSDTLSISYIGVITTSSALSGASGFIQISRDSGAATYQSQLQINGISNNPNWAVNIPANWTVLDIVAAGTHTYNVQAMASSGNTIFVHDSILVAYEI